MYILLLCLVEMNHAPNMSFMYEYIVLKYILIISIIIAKAIPGKPKGLVFLFYVYIRGVAESASATFGVLI